MDTCGYMYLNRLLAVIVAWLNSSQSSQFFAEHSVQAVIQFGGLA